MPDDQDRDQPDIDLSLEDLDDVAEEAARAQPPMPSAAPGRDMLVIDSHDLLDLDHAPAAAPPATDYPAAAAYPAAQPGAPGALAKSKKGAFAGGLVGSLLIQMAVAGALGGLLAWVLNEPRSYLGDEHGTPADMLAHVLLCLSIGAAAAGGLGLALGFTQTSRRGQEYVPPMIGAAIGVIAASALAGIGAALASSTARTAVAWSQSSGQPLRDFFEAKAVSHTVVFMATIGALTGLCIGLVDGLYSANTRKLAIGGSIGAGAGLLTGALGGLVAQLMYGWLVPNIQPSETLSFFPLIQQILARTIGWGIAGLAVGLGLGLAHGLPSRAIRKIINGILGGALGGFVGGFVFDPLGMVLQGFGSRLIAITLIGGLSGAGIGLIEQLRKQAWVAVVGGPLTGKQFILYNQITTIGSSPTCDIALLKDPHIAAQHCVIEVAGHSYQLRDLGAGTTVNGRPVQRHPLRAGDVIQIGSTALEYQDRALRGGGFTPER